MCGGKKEKLEDEELLEPFSKIFIFCKRSRVLVVRMRERGLFGILLKRE